MKAVSFYKPLPIKDPESFVDVVVEKPSPGPRDLLVEVRAISVNPVDTKIRAGGGPGSPYDELKILGSLTRTEDHFDELVESMAPQSAMALIENPARPLEITKLKPKSISLHWEFMFTRSRYQTPDMEEQGRLLNEVAGLVHTDRIQSTLKTKLDTINAANMKRAHALVESGRTIGKVVLCAF